jgi:DivIVA domain-containing protein
MGIQDVAGWALVACGVVNVGRALPPLVRRSAARSGAIPAGVWSGLLLGLGFLVSGFLYLRDPGDPHGTWLIWIPVTLGAAGLLLPAVPWIKSRRRAGRLDPGPADPPALSSADPPDARTAGLIERVKNVRFGTTRLAPGYDEEEVDIFLDKLVAALSRNGQVDRSELRDVRFSTTRLRPGYAMPDVDTFLQEVAQATW